jgi:hypothetical protein
MDIEWAAGELIVDQVNVVAGLDHLVALGAAFGIDLLE